MNAQVSATPAIFALEPGVYKVASSRDARVKHTVRVNPDGTLRCNCEWSSSPTGYAKTGKPCRHMLAIKEIETMCDMEPTFRPVVDPSDFDEDPFELVIPTMKPRTEPAGTGTGPIPALPVGHKPMMFELVAFWEN